MGMGQELGLYLEEFQGYTRKVILGRRIKCTLFDEEYHKHGNEAGTRVIPGRIPGVYMEGNTWKDDKVYLFEIIIPQTWE
jgi:hypothetical protein